METNAYTRLHPVSETSLGFHDLETVAAQPCHATVFLVTTLRLKSWPTRPKEIEAR